MTGIECILQKISQVRNRVQVWSAAGYPVCVRRLVRRQGCDKVMLLPTGTVLTDRYEIQRVLGQGGMGAVYLATDKRIPEKTWAVKELWDFGDPDTRSLVQTQFQREASILAALDHPNLPRITDFFLENNKEYLVMDFVEGQTLESVLEQTKGPMDVDALMKMAEQIMDVLEYLHSQDPPIIFRDIKPANIMVSSSGKVKLIDFGIARIFTSGKQKDTIIMGTPGFASPEQYGRGQTDARADIYGLGATLYYCVTGQDPSDNPFHFEEPVKLNPKVPDRLSRAVLKCVQMDVADRFQSVKEMREYLFSAEARTTMYLPTVQGTQQKPQDAAPAGEVKLEPEELNFGILKRGDTLKRKLVVRGKVANAKMSADRSWIRVYPNLVSGDDQEIGVTVYTTSLNYGGKYQGRVTLKGEHLQKHLPVKLEIEPKHLNFLSYVLFFFFTVLSLVPVVGFIGFFYNMISYFAIPPGERKSVKIFFYLSLFTALLWTTVGVIWYGVTYLGWFKGLNFHF